MSDRRYYSVRTGKNRGMRFELPNLLELFKLIFVDFVQKDYFQEAFGYYCIDAGDVDGIMGSSIKGFFLRKLRKPDLWPVAERYTHYSEDDLFDVIELLHDYVSKPTGGTFHTYNNCGWHYEQFDHAAGREEFRTELNMLLRDYAEGYRLSEQGEIETLGPSGTETLLGAELPDYDEQKVNSRVMEAVQQFRSRHSSMTDRRDAVRNLGDVLEFLRPELKKVLTKDDENDLFNILNKFGLRHHNQRQKTDYDELIFLTWVFYHYLAAIHAAVRLIQRQKEQET